MVYVELTKDGCCDKILKLKDEGWILQVKQNIDYAHLFFSFAEDRESETDAMLANSLLIWSTSGLSKSYVLTASTHIRRHRVRRSILRPGEKAVMARTDAPLTFI